jgi:serine/threonine-protein kinase
MTDHRQPDPDATAAYTPLPAGARFAAGEVLAGRYRVVAPLGRGGMGEVYRADDLALGVPVALKFLPGPLATDPDRLARFRKEVAVARRVSHPHCCRVYDLAEADGQPFLTMEYIDGEDLAGLLNRVGRLPEEKGLEIARQLCQALAAVHEQGLLHRDLKPANVMLDGRGRVRLTDFGLAAAAEDLSATELRSGTPQYMAPEQLAGREVSVRSDLFSLGLVLYELFTGKRAFPADSRAELARRYDSGPPSKPSSHVSGLASAVERAILRCLARDPADRPPSALAVAAALPGGDPLAAALAAGETPSPETVANAPIEGALRPAVALALLAAVLLGAYGVAQLNDRTKLFRQVPLQDAPPEVLAQRARDLLAGFGYTDPPAGRAGGYAEDRPAALYFWYRHSPAPLTNREIAFVPGFRGLPGWVTPTEPPTTVPGMATLAVDLKGRLLEFRAVPPPLAPAGPAAGPPPDWSALLRAAGLDLTGFRGDDAPRRTPPVYADRRAAWNGPDPDNPGADLHVEAAAFQGRPVYFYRGPADGPDRLARPRPGSGLAAVAVAVTLALSVGVILAWRNVRLGRANLPGAGRLAACSVLLELLAWGLLTTHVPAFFEEAASFIGLLGLAVWSSGLLALWYLALEPTIRRRWPWVVVGWNRLLEGRWRDPLVGRDTLIGGLAGVAVALLFQALVLLPGWLGQPPPAPLGIREDLLGHGPALVVIGLLDALYSAIARFFILNLLILLIRRVAWGVAAGMLFVSLAVLTGGYTTGNRMLSGDPGVLAVAVQMTAVAVTFAVLLRFGLLAYVSVMVSSVLLMSAPLTTDLSAWYAPSGLVCALALAGLTVYGFVVSLGGRPLVGKGFLGDD